MAGMKCLIGKYSCNGPCAPALTKTLIKEQILYVKSYK